MLFQGTPVLLSLRDLINLPFGEWIISHSPTQRLAQARMMFSTEKSTICCSKPSLPPTSQPEGMLKLRQHLVSWLSHANTRQQAQVRKQLAWLLPYRAEKSYAISSILSAFSRLIYVSLDILKRAAFRRKQSSSCWSH